MKSSNISNNMFIFTLFVFMAAGFTLLYIHFSSTIHDEPVEETVELKYSKKGLYLYPRFEVHVSNSERPSKISKEQFDAIQVGDKISGYMKNADTFVTEKDIQFEKTLAIPVFIFLYFPVMMFGCLLLKDIKFIKNNHTRKEQIKRILKISGYSLLTAYIILGMIFVILTAINIFNKMNEWNQTEVTATVIDGDFNETRSHKGASYTTYELFLHYQDREGRDYITKKAVTGTTYNEYRLEENIPLIYRNNNVHDTFISTESVNEIWPAFLNLFTIFLGFYIVSLFAMYKAWRKMKKNKKEIQDVIIENNKKNKHLY
ncbi:hypothetical protein [Oceanobacillus sp. 1P07AA]|uniref:hypothetical protein n=1 Tax=Oceanobacillus sp. 1P07AA TaxID=3132293 RepID=UPI0039A4EB2F